jgi:hypothetical protein
MMGREMTTDIDFFRKLAGLSFLGDIRVDDNEKVNKLVEKNLTEFKRIYGPVVLR